MRLFPSPKNRIMRRPGVRFFPGPKNRAKFSKKYYFSRLYILQYSKWKRQLSRCRPKMHSISANTYLPTSYSKKEHYSSPICLPSSLFLWWQHMWEVCCCYSVQEERGFGSWKLHWKCIESAQATKIVLEQWCNRKSKILKANSDYHKVASSNILV